MKYCSWQLIRNYAEKFRWRDRRTGTEIVGYHPPNGVPHDRVPFYVKFITKTGKVEEGNVVSLTVDRRTHLRMVQFVKSNQIREIRDFLIIEIDGMHFK